MERGKQAYSVSYKKNHEATDTSEHPTINTSFVSMKNKKEKGSVPKRGEKGAAAKRGEDRGPRPRGVKGASAKKCDGPEAKRTEAIVWHTF